jgi:peptide/nickel transport system substrate-binding protein
MGWIARTRRSGVASSLRARREAPWRLRVRVIVLTAIGLSVVLGSSAGTAASRTSATKPVLRIGIASLASGFTPEKQFISSDLMNTDLLVYAEMLHPKADGSYAPELAVSWHYLPAPRGSGLQNKRFEFTLRKDARFSDGTPVTAQAVKASFEYINAKMPVSVYYMGPISSVTTVGKWTVRILLKSPNPNITEALGRHYPAFALACTKNPSLFATQSCGAGPYQIDFGRSVLGDHLTLTPNPYYYDKQSQPWSQIQQKQIANPTSMLQAVQSGQIDLAEGDFSTASAAERAGLKVIHGPATNNCLVLDVPGKYLKALADLRVRQALNYAIDRKTITQQLAGKFGTPTSEIATYDGYDSDSKITNYYPYNPTKAKALLASAGYSSGLTIKTVSYGPFGRAGTPAVQAVAKYLAAVGVTLEIQPTASTSQWGAYYGSVPMLQAPFGAGNMQVYFSILTGDMGVKDPVINNLWYQKASRAKSDAERVKYTQEISRRIVSQAYFVQLMTMDRVYFLNSKKVTMIGPPVSLKRNTPDPTEWRPLS